MSIRIKHPKFPSAKVALAWLKENHYEKLNWPEAHAQILMACAPKLGITRSFTQLRFQDGTVLHQNNIAIEKLRRSD